MGKKLIFLSAFLILIIQSCSSSVLTCNYSSGSCNVTSITDVISVNEKISVAGKAAGFIDTVTTILNFRSPSILHYVPTSLFTTFPNLQSLSMNNVYLNYLVTDAFVNAGNLDYVDITGNDFSDLPASFCSSCINVTTMYLVSNNIVNLDKDGLKGFKFLRTIDLSYNKISCIPPEFFQNNRILLQINLANNQITSIDRMTFKGLVSANYISLDSNQIAAIPDLDFSLTGLTGPFGLMLQNNPVMAVHPKFITNIFEKRSAYGGFYMNAHDNYGNVTTCFPKYSKYPFMYIDFMYWPLVDIQLEDCYANWTPELESTPVSCASAIETTTTSTTPSRFSTTTAKNFNNETNEYFRHFGISKNLFAILSNGGRNFTANVQFN